MREKEQSLESYVMVRQIEGKRKKSRGTIKEAGA